MTQMRRNEIITQMLELITEIAEDNLTALSAAETVPPKVEMLTVKECTEVVQGLSEHTVRQLVTQNKIPHIRAGLGKRGKILINKSDLLHYIKSE